MAVENDANQDEGYNEDDDDDFNPEIAVADREGTSSEESSEESESAATQRAKSSSRPHKKARTTENLEERADELDFANSGDEGIIKEGSKAERKQKRRRKNEEPDDDSGGDGGFVKTRSMRAAAEHVTARKSAALTGKVTADIDAIWARLKSGANEPSSLGSQDKPSEVENIENDDTITIKRTYTFAGKLHTETKVVPKLSAQAQAYLATKDSRVGADSEPLEESSAEKMQYKTGPQGQVLSRPRRRNSAWDPNPTGFIKGLPAAPTIARIDVAGNALKVTDKTHLGQDARLWHYTAPQLVMTGGRKILQSTQGPAPVSNLNKLKAQKLNVVDKSKLDWAEHVDTVEGAREELEQAKKDKSSYLERRDFLNRVEDKEESDRAKARGVVR